MPLRPFLGNVWTLNTVKKDIESKNIPKSALSFKCLTAEVSGCVCFCSSSLPHTCEFCFIDKVSKYCEMYAMVVTPRCTIEFNYV